MAYFEKRANGWRAQIRKKGYPSLSATFPTRSEAERWAAEIEGDMSRARFVDTREAQQTTLADALKRYQREISDHKKGAAQESARIARWLGHPLARRPIGSIRSSDLAEYRDNALKSLSPSTVRLNLAIISHLFTIAIKEWGIEGLTNPCRSLRMPSTTSNARERRPTTAELERLYKAAA